MLIVNACGNEEFIPATECSGVLTITIDGTTATNCGEANGAIQVSANGETPQFSIEGVGTNTTGTFTDLAAGTYTVVVTDGSNGCEATATATISATSGLEIDELTTTDADCSTGGGSITVTATGGDGDYMFKLDQGSFQGSGNFTDVSSGIHTVTLTDGTGCEFSQQVTLTSGVSFSQQVKSIIDMNCAISGCHVAGTGRLNFTSLAGVQGQASRIASRVVGGSMPPSSQPDLTTDEIALIVCWVEDGALDN